MDDKVLATVPDHTKAGLALMNASAMNKEEQAIAAAKAINLMREGMLLDDISKELGLSQGRISQLVLELYPEQWKKAKTAANLIRYDKAQREFDNNGEDGDKPLDGLKLAYARERAKYAHLMLQATRRDIFDLSDKTAINVNAAGQVSIQVISYDSSNSAPDHTQVIDNPK